MKLQWGTSMVSCASMQLFQLLGRFPCRAQCMGRVPQAQGQRSAGQAHTRWHHPLCPTPCHQPAAAGGMFGDHLSHHAGDEVNTVCLENTHTHACTRTHTDCGIWTGLWWWMQVDLGGVRKVDNVVWHDGKMSRFAQCGRESIMRGAVMNLCGLMKTQLGGVALSGKACCSKDCRLISVSSCVLDQCCQQLLPTHHGWVLIKVCRFCWPTAVTGCSLYMSVSATELRHSECRDAVSSNNSVFMGRPACLLKVVVVLTCANFEVFSGLRRSTLMKLS